MRELLASVVGELLRAEGRVLCVGRHLQAPPEWDRVLDLLSVPPAGGPYALALWDGQGELVHGLLRLRGLLMGGAPVVIAWGMPMPLLATVRAALGKGGRKLILEEVCGALLRTGYHAPRVHAFQTGRGIISAVLPARISRLDALLAAAEAQ